MESRRVLFRSDGAARPAPGRRPERTTEARTAMAIRRPSVMADRSEETGPNHIIAPTLGSSQLGEGWDPIDGTSNFAHGLPLYAISIAIVYKGKPIIGVVEIPALKETFWAQEGRGAYLGNKQIHVSKRDKLQQSMFATGFPYARESDRYRKNIELFDAFYKASNGVRRFGSAAIDLCFTAAGRFDGFWEYALKPWDIAAGKIIMEEAGGMVTNMDGSLFNHKLENILASNGLLHSEMLRIIKEHGADKV